MLKSWDERLEGTEYVLGPKISSHGLLADFKENDIHF
jgi:hypothetical protein